MKLSIKSMIVTLAMLSTPIVAQANELVEIAAEFKYDQAQTAEANYTEMVNSAKDACKALDKRSDSLTYHVIREAQENCVTDLVGRGVAKFDKSDLTITHRLAMGEPLVRTAQVNN